MTKIYSWVPTWCSFKASIEKPEDWDKKTLKEKKDYFSQNMEQEASLCHQCSSEVETDFALDDKSYNENKMWSESDFFEED